MIQWRHPEATSVCVGSNWDFRVSDTPSFTQNRKVSLVPSETQQRINGRPCPLHALDRRASSPVNAGELESSEQLVF